MIQIATSSKLEHGHQTIVWVYLNPIFRTETRLQSHFQIANEIIEKIEITDVTGITDRTDITQLTDSVTIVWGSYTSEKSEKYVCWISKTRNDTIVRV